MQYNHEPLLLRTLYPKRFVLSGTQLRKTSRPQAQEKRDQFVQSSARIAYQEPPQNPAPVSAYFAIVNAKFSSSCSLFSGPIGENFITIGSERISRRLPTSDGTNSRRTSRFVSRIIFAMKKSMPLEAVGVQKGIIAGSRPARKSSAKLQPLMLSSSRI